MAENNLRGKAISSLFWQGLNVGAFSLMSIAHLMIMARLVDKEWHGIYAIINAIVLMAAVIGQAGLGYALIQRKVSTAAETSFAFYGTILLSGLITLVLIVLSPLIADIYGVEFKAKFLAVGMLGVFLASPGIVARSLLMKELDYKRVFIGQCGGFFIGNLMLGVGLAYFDFGIWSLLLGLLFYHASASILYYAMCPHSLKWVWTKDQVVEVKDWSIGFTLTELLNTASHMVDKLLFGLYVLPTTLAIYEKGQQTARLPGRVLGSTFDSVFYSYLAQRQEDTRAMSTIYILVLQVFTFIAAIIFAILFVFAHHIVIILLGVKWIEAVPILMIFAVPFSLGLLSKHADVIMRVTNKLYLAARIKAVFLIAVILVTVMVGNFSVGYMPYAISMTMSAYFLVLIFYSFVLLDAKWSIVLWSLVRPVFYVLLTVAYAYAVRYVAGDNLGRLVTILGFLTSWLVISGLSFYYRPSLYGRQLSSAIVRYGLDISDQRFDMLSIILNKIKQRLHVV